MPKAVTRRVGALLESGRAAVVEDPVPTLSVGQILVKVGASLLSPGSELAGARIARQSNNNSTKILCFFGYQNAGTVTKVHPSVKRWVPGDRVACMGAGALHADLVAVPQNLAVSLPDSVSFEEGAYCHLAATALHAIYRSQLCIGDQVLIVGAGLVGQLSLQLAKLSGAYVQVWDNLPGRLAIAIACGADATHDTHAADQAAISAANEFTRGHGFDVAILAVGGDGTPILEKVRDVMRLTPDKHREGKLIMVGGLETTSQWGSGMGNLDVLSSARTGPGYHDDNWEIGQHEYPDAWIRHSTRGNLELVIRLLSERRLDAKALTTHRLALDQIDEAVSLHIDRPDSTLGTILLMHEELTRHR